VPRKPKKIQNAGWFTFTLLIVGYCPDCLGWSHLQPPNSRPTTMRCCARGTTLSELENIWNRASGLLRSEVSESTFQVWLEPLRPALLEPGVLLVEASDSIRSWVESRFSGLLSEAASNAAGRPMTVEIVAPGQIGVSGNQLKCSLRESVASASEPTQLETADLNPKFDFEQFVIGEENRLAHAAALAVAEMPGQAYNPLFIYGPPGVGKTHLLHSIGNFIESHGEARRVIYTTAEEFTNQFVGSLRGGGIETFKALYRTTDVLLIDDIQFLESKARTEEEFFHTFNAIHDTGAQLVISSDRTPADLGALEERLRERFGSGLVVDIQPPDIQTRTSILAMRVRRDGLAEVPRETLVTIAQRIRGNVRMLEGALIRVVAYASLTGSEVTKELASEVLEQIYPEQSREKAGPASSDQIKRIVAEAYGLDCSQLESKSRSANVLWPRQVAMYLAREVSEQPLPEIGRSFGGRNHSTVINACKRVQQRIASDPQEALAIRALERRITSNDRAA